MNSAQANPALMQLEDIVLPQQISQWPMAPGYWILAALVIGITIAMVVKLKRDKQYHAPRKAALDVLNQLDIASPQYATEVNSLLKRTAMSYFPRQDFAKLDGNHWFAWLELRLPKQHHGQIGLLLNKRYQSQGLSQAETKQLQQLAHVFLAKSARLTAFNPNELTSSMIAKQNDKEDSCSQ
ncbi:hypothetical protein A9267_19420 [Shewanella sp. UCD-FRSSP16_17]|uniref:DUF4381 domain-containing protein n=1 Tax=Shewanella sp. UCD-FRSSP16_17 TaxID=1853256 RepID=UPI0007EEDB18|nr:DUF4381 domain-containing protein [Shewanella sp. UCD-FRSSP16_17]OBT03765.1 hypothetical protein A9267_19420 [Shewanella sp. UCD-FRSSP16_17]